MHYVCEGDCGGVAEDEGNCQSEGCSKHGEALAGCECEDKNHGKEAAEETASE